ncbi:39165_t:CDS:2 [Gigaspora margarita]|uniref:39165_t:CDS:1 n=1 Tax=Gigaspora margarita TaxID=4874 RepID=A0ABM8VZF7_GIGMA|nr:39165_t:CDS:2 [Gigaspora margarita]
MLKKYKTIKEIESIENHSQKDLNGEKSLFSQSYKIRNRGMVSFFRSIKDFAESNKIRYLQKDITELNNPLLYSNLEINYNTCLKEMKTKAINFGLFYIRQRNVIIGDEIFRMKMAKIINAKLNKNPFDSKYNKIRNYRITLFRSIDDYLSQSLLPTPNENHIIILHYYSTSKLKILFNHHMLKNQKKNDKKYKTIKEIEDSSTKELTTNNEQFDNHSQKVLNDNKMEKPQFSQSLSFYKINRLIKEINVLHNRIKNIELQLQELRGLVEVSVKELEGLECRHSEEDLDDKNESDPDDNRISEIQQGIEIAKEKLKEYKEKLKEFNDLNSTKTNDADISNCITFRMNEMNMLNDTIENIKLQLKELRVLFEDSVKECHHSKEDLDVKSESDPDKNRISEIQQGIEIAKENFNCSIIGINCL